MARFFINRPIVAMVISIIMVLVGIVAIRGLPVAQFPNIVLPEIQVKATYTASGSAAVTSTAPATVNGAVRPSDNVTVAFKG